MEEPLLKRAPERWPDDGPFLQAASSLERSGRIEELIRLFESRVQELPIPAEAVRELTRDRIKDLSRAEDFFRRALLFAPGAKEPLKGLSTLLEQRQDYASLAELLETAARSTSGPERAALLLKAADHYASLAEQLAEDPVEHPLAGDAARIALEIQPGNARAEKVQKALKQFDLSWRDRVRLLRTASLEERDRKRAARLSLLVAKLFAWCDSAARNKVKEALDRSFLLWPGMPAAVDFLERLAAKEQDFPGAVRFLEGMAQELKDRPVQSQLWTRAGLLRLKLDDRAGALLDFEKAADADLSRPECIALAAELLLEKNRAGEALSLYERQ